MAFDERLKDLIVDEVIVTPGVDAGGNVHLQVNGVMMDGKAAWISLIIRPQVMTKLGQPFEDDEEGEAEAANALRKAGFTVGDLTNLPPARPEVRG